MKALGLKRKKDFHPSRSHYKSIVQPSQVPAITNTDSDDPFRHRNMVVHELLKTECAYLEDLRVIIGFYLKPLQHDLKLIGSYDCKSLFKNVEELFLISWEFYEELLTEYSKPPQEQRIGTVFMGMGKEREGLRQYNVYCCNQAAAESTLRKLWKTKQDFRLFCDAVLNLPESNKQNLNSFLVKPFQRICRYSLLLKELMKHTPDNWDDKTSLMEAYAKFDKAVKSANEAKRMADNLFTIVNLQNCLILPENEQPLLKSLHQYQSDLLDEEEFIEFESDGKETRTRIFLFAQFSIFAHPKGKKFIKNDLMMSCDITVSLMTWPQLAFRPKKIDESGSFPFIIETRQADRKHLLYTQDEQQRKKWSHTGHVTTRRLSLNAEDNVDSMKLNKKTRDRLLAEQLELKMKNHTKLLEEDLRKLEAIDDVELEQQLVKSIEEKKLGIEAMNDTLKSLRDEKEKPQLSNILSFKWATEIPKDIIQSLQEESIKHEEQQKAETSSKMHARARSSTFEQKLARRVHRTYENKTEEAKEKLCEEENEQQRMRLATLLVRETAILAALNDSPRLRASDLSAMKRRKMAVRQNAPGWTKGASPNDGMAEQDDEEEEEEESAIDDRTKQEENSENEIIEENSSNEEENEESTSASKSTRQYSTDSQEDFMKAEGSTSDDDDDEERPFVAGADEDEIVKSLLLQRVEEQRERMRQTDLALTYCAGDPEARVVLLMRKEELSTTLDALKKNLRAMFGNEVLDDHAENLSPQHPPPPPPTEEVSHSPRGEDGKWRKSISKVDPSDVRNRHGSGASHLSGSWTAAPSSPRVEVLSSSNERDDGGEGGDAVVGKWRKSLSPNALVSMGHNNSNSSDVPQHPPPPPPSQAPLSPSSSRQKRVAMVDEMSKQELQEYIDLHHVSVLDIEKKVALSEGEDREILLQKKAQHEQTCRDLKNRMAVLEREESIQEVVKTIDGAKDLNLVAPGRMFITHARFVKKAKRSQTREFFLFNDLLLYAAPKASGYVLKGLISLKNCVVSDLQDVGTIKNAISIFRVDQKKQYIISTPIPQLKKEWLELLQNLTEKERSSDEMVTRNSITLQKLREIEKLLDGKPINIEAPGREFILQSRFLKISGKRSQTREFFLFNDMVMYAQPRANRFAYKDHIALKDCNFSNLDDTTTYKNAISIHRNDLNKDYIIHTSDPATKELWMERIAELKKAPS